MHWALATEDELSEAVGLRLLSELPVIMPEPSLFRRNGFGYLKTNISKWRTLARHQAVVVITDLDRKCCPPSMLQIIHIFAGFSECKSDGHDFLEYAPEGRLKSPSLGMGPGRLRRSPWTEESAEVPSRSTDLRAGPEKREGVPGAWCF